MRRAHVAGRGDGDSLWKGEDTGGVFPRRATGQEASPDKQCGVPTDV